MRGTSHLLLQGGVNQQKDNQDFLVCIFVFVLIFEESAADELTL